MFTKRFVVVHDPSDEDWPWDVFDRGRRRDQFDFSASFESFDEAVEFAADKNVDFK